MIWLGDVLLCRPIEGGISKSHNSYLRDYSSHSVTLYCRFETRAWCVIFKAVLVTNRALQVLHLSSGYLRKYDFNSMIRLRK